jgi:hypothetical protein
MYAIANKNNRNAAARIMIHHDVPTLSGGFTEMSPVCKNKIYISILFPYRKKVSSKYFVVHKNFTTHSPVNVTDSEPFHPAPTKHLVKRDHIPTTLKILFFQQVHFYNYTHFNISLSIIN